MIAVVGGLADVERDLIRTRTAAIGRKRADTIWGAAEAHATQQPREARQRQAEGTTLNELAKSYNVGVATISRLAV